MNYQGKRVLVTGGGGFLGSHLAEALERDGARVRTMVHYRSDGSRGWLDVSPLASEMEIIGGDVRDWDCCARACAGVDVVFHLAALIAIPYSYRAPRSYMDTNAIGTLNMLRAAIETGVSRFVHTSTSEVYGTACYCPMDEAHPLCAQSPYSASKIAADKIAEAMHRSFGLPVVTVRPFNAFGPRQSARAIVPTIIGQQLANIAACRVTPQSYVEVRLGNVAPVRDLNYVSNTVDGFLLAGSVPGVEGRTFNLGSGRGVSIQEVLDTISRLLGCTYMLATDPERVRPAASEVDRLVCDGSMARMALGWEPRIGLEEGLSRTIDWMRQNAGRYRACEYAV